MKSSNVKAPSYPFRKIIPVNTQNKPAFILQHIARHPQKEGSLDGAVKHLSTSVRTKKSHKHKTFVAWKGLIDKKDTPKRLHLFV